MWPGQAVSGNPFFTVALPIILGLFVSTFGAAWWQNKRIDDLRSDMNRQFDGVTHRFDAVDRRLERIEAKLDGHAERIAKLEGPTPVRG